MADIKPGLPLPKKKSTYKTKKVEVQKIKIPHNIHLLKNKFVKIEEK